MTLIAITFHNTAQVLNSSQPIIAVALVGVLRVPQVLNQIRTIRRNSGGQRTPIVMCLDGRHPEPEHLARLLNISVAIYDEERVKTGRSG